MIQVSPSFEITRPQQQSITDLDITVNKYYESQPNKRSQMTKHKILFRDQSLQDAFEQQSAQNWLPLEINQISAGHYQGQIREVRQNGVSVFFEHQNCTVHKRGVMKNDLCTVSFVRSPKSPLRFSEYNAVDSALFFLPGGTEFDIQAGGDAETVYFRFEQSRLLERARAMNPILWEKIPDKLLIFDKIDRKPLDMCTNNLYANPLFQSNSEVAHDGNVLGTSLMDQVAMALNSSPFNEETYRDLIACRRARNMVREAIEYIDAAMENQICPSIVDVCADINVSQRNLQYNFKKIVGLTPNTYLYRLRLNRVRAQLSNPASAEVTVTRVAMHWHFGHLGRFANEYRQLFGESPSVTLRRALS